MTPKVTRPPCCHCSHQLLVSVLTAHPILAELEFSPCSKSGKEVKRLQYRDLEPQVLFRSNIVSSGFRLERSPVSSSWDGVFPDPSPPASSPQELWSPIHVAGVFPKSRPDLVTPIAFGAMTKIRGPLVPSLSPRHPCFFSYQPRSQCR